MSVITAAANMVEDLTATGIPSCLSDKQAIEFVPRTYGERARKGAEPQKRWLTILWRSPGLKWHIKVTFSGTLQGDGDALSRKTKRRTDLQELCLHIDYQQIQLYDNTVTELLITGKRGMNACSLPLRSSLEVDCEYSSIAHTLWLTTREDPLRVRFPPYCPPAETQTRTEDVSNIIMRCDLQAGVHLVSIKRPSQQSYVYKTFETPLHVPQDSAILEQELRNLERVRDTEFIVQLVAVVTSTNPYQTIETQDATTVFRGILLEYHPNGTLEKALETATPRIQGRLLTWALQMAQAVRCLHENGLTHMDLKPSNVVINAKRNAVLIDISGIGGVTREWLSPKLQTEADPLSQSLEVRKANDIWVLGKMLFLLSEVFRGENEVLLGPMALAAMQVPNSTTLDDIIRNLSQRDPNHSSSLSSTSL